MPRPRNAVPTNRRHSSGRAVVSVYRADGSSAEALLAGAYGSDESREEYERVLAQLRTNRGTVSHCKADSDITIVELVARFMREFVDVHYRDQNGEPTKERAGFVDSLRPLVRLFGSKLAREFTPVDLRTYRESIIGGSWRTTEEKAALKKKCGQDGTVSRGVVNVRCARVKRLFRWAVELMVVPASVWHGLQAVAGLRRGRSTARETKSVTPVSTGVVDGTLSHLPPVVRDMVQILFLTGMRCGELCMMRAADLDMSGEIWLYRPERHKNRWRGKSRLVYLLAYRIDLAFRPRGFHAHLFAQLPNLSYQESPRLTWTSPPPPAPWPTRYVLGKVACRPGDLCPPRNWLADIESLATQLGLAGLDDRRVGSDRTERVALFREIRAHYLREVVALVSNRAREAQPLARLLFEESTLSITLDGKEFTPVHPWINLIRNSA